MKKLLLFVFLLICSMSLAAAVECNNGYEFRPRSGVGCVQIDCTDIPNAHYGYVGDCICGSSGSMYENPEDPNKECRRPADYESCPSCVYACVHIDENCPDDLTPQVSLPEKIETPEAPEPTYEEVEESGNKVAAIIEEVKADLQKWKDEQKEQREKNYLDSLDENGCAPNEYAVYYKHSKTGEIFQSCTCRPGFKRGEQKCEFDKPDIGLEGWDAIKLEKTLLELQPNKHSIIEVEINGEKVKIGIVRKSDYELAYTVDGVKWDSNLKDMINPSMWTRTKNNWDKAWSYANPINWFNWHTKYKDEDKELKWQIADATLKRYDKDVTQPKHYMYAVESWYKYAEDKRQAAIKLRDAGLIPGSVDLTKDYVWNDLKGNLETFPAQAVHTMAKELRTDDFAQAFSYYIEERESRTPQEIMNNPSEELDLAISAGTASVLGDILLYQKYEEAYQRYQVAKSMKK